MKTIFLQLSRLNSLFLILLFNLLTFLPNSFSQGLTCGIIDTSGNQNIELRGFKGLDFYDENNGCEPLVLRCNFVFLTRDDGTGTFPDNSQVIADMINGMNNLWASVHDPANCSPNQGYPLDSKLRVEVGIDYIANTSAFDYYGRAVSMGSSYYKSAFCPDNVDDDNNSTWPALNTVIDNYNSSHPNTFNFFFVENNAFLTYLEQSIANGDSSIHIPWVDTNNIDIFDGCSKFAYAFNSTENQFIIMTGVYTEYLWRKYFGNVYAPDADTSNEVILSWHLTGLDNLANHELGHSIMNDGGSNCFCLNLMRECSYIPGTQYLSPSQLEKLHKTLSTTNNHKYIDCGSLSASNCPVYVVEDETITAPMSVFGDLIIEEGITLTVESTIHLNEQSQIIVKPHAKLIVDGGKLTSSRCSSTWIGIEVYGGNTDFDVKFTNGAVIENTHHAAVSMFSPEPWPAITQWGNGILHAENTTFNNTKRIVEFISWEPLPNSSYIKNCAQNGGKWGVTNWNCLGIEVTNNIFKNITKECIVSVDGSYSIEENEFHSGTSNILLINTTAGQGSTIKNNNFYGNVGIRSYGVSLSPTIVEENSFYNIPYGIFMDGKNYYHIKHNNFDCSLGVVTINSGKQYNRVRKNLFNPGTVAGIVTRGNNKGFVFTHNCYNTLYIDNFIDGSIAYVQSNPFFQPANNCFTHMGNPATNNTDIGGNPEPFFYIEPDDEIVNCKDAILADPNVMRYFHGQEEPTDCGTTTVEPIDSLDQLSHCNPPENLTDILNAKTWLENKLVSVESDFSLDSIEKMAQLQIYNHCLDRVTLMLYSYYLENDQFQNARSVYANDTSADAVVYKYTSYIYEGALQAASNFINNISTTNSMLNDFLTIQSININRLQAGPNFTASTSQLNTVYTIAMKSHPYAAYAKSLYYVLTDSLLKSDVPALMDSLAGQRIKAKENSTSFDIFPNPFNSQLHIKIKNGKDGKKSLTVYDINGNVMLKDKYEKSYVETINTTSWHLGVYFIKITNGSKVMYDKKIILIK